ncbi:MAG: amidohydrolase family protein [Myxococcota bacterium]
MFVLHWFEQALAACTVITGANVHTPSGVTKGAVVIVDERIAAVGAVDGLVGTAWRGTPCAAVDGSGGELTAGLIALPNGMGLVEIELEQASRNDDPHTDDPIRGGLYAADGYDPLATLIPVGRLHGVTAALSAPSGGFVAGHAAVVKLDGETQRQAVVVRDAAVMMSVPTGSFAEGLNEIRDLVARLRMYHDKPALFWSGAPYPEGATDTDMAALVPMALGKVPVVVGADKASEIEALIRLREELGLKLVISGAAEGWIVSKSLAEAGIPVIVDPLVVGPYGFDQLHARPDNAALLQAAGVPLILGAWDPHQVRTLRQVAGNAVREGLDHEHALAAITSTPARVFGIPDRGSVAVGQLADLVLWSADPFETTTVAEQVWITGRSVPLTSRQTELREKYRTLPGTPAPPLDPAPLAR